MVSIKLGVWRRYALHMKPGHGPTVEGMLVRRTRRAFVLMNATVREDADRSYDLAGTIEIPRENVYGLQELA